MVSVSEHLSSSYEVLRNSGIFRLPLQRTLWDCTYFTTSGADFSYGVDEQLREAQLALINAQKGRSLDESV